MIKENGKHLFYIVTESGRAFPVMAYNEKGAFLSEKCWFHSGAVLSIVNTENGKTKKYTVKRG